MQDCDSEAHVQGGASAASKRVSLGIKTDAASLANGGITLRISVGGQSRSSATRLPGEILPEGGLVEDFSIDAIAGEIGEPASPLLADASPEGPFRTKGALCEEASPSANQPKKVKAGDVLFYLALVLIVVAAAVFFGGSGGGPKTLAGYSAFTVTTGSMHDVLPQGSLIVTKQVDPETLQIGDDITYMTSETTSITHRIVGIEEEYEPTGERAFETKGTMNAKPDTKLVPAVNVVGKVVFCSPLLGSIVGFIQDDWPLLLFLACVAGGLAFTLRRILR